MSNRKDQSTTTETWPRCDCGYLCQGDTLEDRVGDGQRHAQEVHGIEVSAEQVLEQVANSQTRSSNAHQTIS